MTPTQPAPLDDAGALAVLDEHADEIAYDDLHSGIARKENRAIEQRAKYRAAVTHLAARLAELEMEAAGATAAYERFTAYTIVHDGAMRYCSSEMRDAYADMKVRADRAEAELAAVREDAERYRWLAKNRVRSASNCFRSRGQELHFLFDHLWDDTLDAAIDAARGAG